MRVPLLTNHSVREGWANGTLARPSESWTAPSQHLFQLQSDSKTTTSAQIAHLSYAQSRDFSVRVIKDDGKTIAKDVRFKATDITCIGSSNSKSMSAEWVQVQMTLAYALTARKAQSLTIPKLFPSLMGIFGFGIPYVVLTRTMLEEDMCFVGVPPREIYEHLRKTTLPEGTSWKE